MRSVRAAWFVILLCAAGCAGSLSETTEPDEVRGGSAGAGVASLEIEARKAAERLKELERRRARRAAGSESEIDLIQRRYEELLTQPGTSEERKPEILLRLAELAYRQEEADLRAAYEGGDEPGVAPDARYKEAIDSYLRLVKTYPDSPQALTAFYNLGYLYAERVDTRRSAWAYGEVLQRDPHSPYADEIHMRLGEAAFDVGDLDRAIEHYAAVAATGKPEYVDKALYKLGWCYYNLEDYGRAVDAFSRILKQGRASPEDLRRETLEVLSRSFFESGGVEALRRYLDERPEARMHGAELYRRLGNRNLGASRYREAVDAYIAGVDAYPDSAQCLEMERGILQSFLVLRDQESAGARRESWQQRYGSGSSWDRVHGFGPLARDRDVLVEEGLRLAALYRHGLAQRGQGDLDRALALYERYIEVFGVASEAGYEMAYAHAQGLREAGRWVEAAARYREVATHRDWTSHREDAGYRRIEVLTTLHERDPSLLDELVEAHEEYARLNPTSPLVPELIFAEGELLFEAERFAAARGVFERVSLRHRGHELVAQALENIARCYFREEAYEETEGAARRALAAGLGPAAAERVRKLLAFAIFKQAELRETARDFDGANRHFFRLADELPQQEAAPIALYRAAENLRKGGRDDEAARVYERLAGSYPGSEHAQSALVLSARIFASLGDWSKAARGYEDLYRASPDAPSAADALFRAARAREQAEEPAAAARLFSEFAEKFPEDPRLAEARFREGRVLLGLGRIEEAAARYRMAWGSQVSGDGAVYRARAALALGKLALGAFRDVALAGDLERALSRKEGLLEEALGELTRAASLPYAETLTEALFRAGEAFEHMKQALLDSERPAGLNEEEREEYDYLLEEKAFPLEERAVGLYRKGIAAAREARVHTVWVDRMFGRLEALQPWAYRRAEEPTLAWDAPGLLPIGDSGVAQ